MGYEVGEAAAETYLVIGVSLKVEHLKKGIEESLFFTWNDSLRGGLPVVCMRVLTL
jgi:hypothetical protein